MCLLKGGMRRRLEHTLMLSRDLMIIDGILFSRCGRRETGREFGASCLNAYLAAGVGEWGKDGWSRITDEEHT